MDRKRRPNFTGADVFLRRTNPLVSPDFYLFSLVNGLTVINMPCLCLQSSTTILQ